MTCSHVFVAHLAGCALATAPQGPRAMSGAAFDANELREEFERKAPRYVIGLGASMLFIGAAAGFLFKEVPGVDAKSSNPSRGYFETLPYPLIDGVRTGIKALAAGTGLCLIASSAASFTISKYYGITTVRCDASERRCAPADLRFRSKSLETELEARRPISVLDVCAGYPGVFETKQHR